MDTEPRQIDFGTGPVDLGRKRGSFPEAAEAFRDSAPIVAQGRPYTPDFLSWFDDFSQTGAYDALGSFSRSQTYVNAFTLSTGTPIPLQPAGRGLQAARQHPPVQALPGRGGGARARRLERLVRRGA